MTFPPMLQAELARVEEEGRGGKKESKRKKMEMQGEIEAPRVFSEGPAARQE